MKAFDRPNLPRQANEARGHPVHQPLRRVLAVDVVRNGEEDSRP